MHYQGLFFDWDGTLVEHSKLIAAGHNHVREHFGLEAYDAHAAINRGHQSMRELYPKLYADRAEEAMKMFDVFFEERHIHDINPFEDTLTLLNTAQNASILMGVVSNKRQKYLDREIDHIGWRHYFHTSVGAGTASADKPSSAPLSLAIKQVSPSLHKGNILYIGDTETDLRCAQDMGCDSLLVTRGRDMNEIIERYKPTLVHETYSELIALLEKSNNQQYQKNA